MRLYFDAAYIIKCYIPEPGGEAVRELARAHKEGLACSIHGRAEFWAAIMRRSREGLLPPKMASTVLRQMEEDEVAGRWVWLPVTALEINLVCELLEKNAGKKGLVLRAADAMHLASARLNGFTKIHSNDKHLLAAAEAFGLDGVDVTGG